MSTTYSFDISEPLNAQSSTVRILLYSNILKMYIETKK